MANFHNTNINPENIGSSIDTGNVDNADKKRQMINELKQKNNIHYHEDNTSGISDEDAFIDIQRSADKFVDSRGGIEEEKELANTLEKNNLLLYCYPYKETSRDKKDVARMAFNGWVDRPNEGELSDFIVKIRKYQAEKFKGKASDYNLSDCSVWNVFKQVPEFAEIEDRLKEGLAKTGINPSDLPKLKLKDICFIMNEELGKEGKDSVKVFKESYKAKNTKKFINENEDDFRIGMYKMLKVSSKEIELAKEITAVTKSIKEKNKNVDPKILEGMLGEAKNKKIKDAGINKESFKKMVKNMAYVERMISEMKEGRTDLSKVDLDETGKSKWDGMPVIDVHHIVNIKDASSREAAGKSFTSINDYSNMCFIVRQPQHDAMHALENDMNGNYREDIFYNRKIDKKFIYRIQPPDGVRCMFGFNSMLYDKEYLLGNEMNKSAIKSRASENNNYYQNRSKWTNDDSEAKRDAIRKENKNISY